ncbi:MAG: hypothetical protein JRE58_04165, partial [Deltaproteobacteria bacterium]|nr:hypothetical protein [Deltaproteobacteria bacterium]
LPPPEVNWQQLNRHLAESETRQDLNRDASYSGENINRLPPSQKPVSQQEQLFIEIKDAATENPLNLAMAWSLRLKKQAVDLPSAFLMGGIPEKSYLAFFFRPLGIGDFIHLWSIGSDDNHSSMQAI